ncbi:MAG: tetratricopeptide repeat protein [Alphaproteobacteria bacterium]|nr:tetratricopeptide repeat protein [Alphaproteobacteria bacterium]
MNDGGDQRRLSAVLAADVVGYTKLMEQDTDGTVAAWKAARSAIIDPTISDHSGRIVKHTGDGFLAEFSTVQDAVKCAVSMQEKLVAGPLDFRIGINLGDIVDDGEDIHGEGVNIAARIEALADPGGILISGSVHDQVFNRLDHRFEDMGTHEVKNVARPVHVFRVVFSDEEPTPPAPPLFTGQRPRLAALTVIILTLAAGLGWWWQNKPDFEPVDPATMAFKLPDKPSIAVLPFDNYSGDPDQEFLSDGLTESIIAVLGATPDLFVIARNSSFTYKGKATKVQQVAQELGVRYVLEGSVQRRGGELRVTAQLIDAIDGRHIWAKRFDRKIDDYFELQDEVAREILVALHGKLTAGSAATWLGREVKDLEIYRMLVTVNRLFVDVTPDNHQEMDGLIREAHRRAPDLAATNGMMAFMLRQKVNFGFSKNPPTDLKAAGEFAKKALSINPEDVGAMKLLAQLAYFAGKHQTSIALADKAIQLRPTEGINIGIAAQIKLWSGQPREALPILEAAMRLDPYAGVWLPGAAAIGYAQIEDFDRSNALARRILKKTTPSSLHHRFTLELMAVNAVRQGDQERGREYINQILNSNPNASLVQSKLLGTGFKDREYLEKFWATLRDLGLPDLPPAQRADPAKMKFKLPDKPSIAVLPFDNMSGDKSRDYIGDGLTENIIAVLATSPDLFVIARNSSFTYKGKASKVQDIAQDLGVRYLLEGSIQTSGDTLRVTIQLIDAIDGKHLWANRYDRKLESLFSLQDDISQRILVELQVKLTRGEQVRAWRREFDDPEVYRVFAQGRALLQTFNPQSLKQAEGIFLDLRQRFPDHALPAVYLGWTHWFNAELGLGDAAKELDEARQFADQALAANPGLSDIHALLANIEVSRGNHAEAIDHGERAVELAPASGDANAAAGWSKIAGGDFVEGVKYHKRAMRFEPFHAGHMPIVLGLGELMAGRYAEVREIAAQLIEGGGGDVRAEPIGLSLKTVADFLAGNKVEAEKSVQRLLTDSPNFSVDFFRNMASFNALKDQAFVSRFFDALRKAGLPDLPPSQRADPAKMKFELPEKPSIAVLPFDNLSGDESQDFIGESLTENIIAVLASSPKLFVIARNSSFTYKGKATKVQKIAEDLGVQFILEGSFTRSGDKLRVTAQLVDAIDGMHVWSERYDRNLHDLFALQDEVAARIAVALDVELVSGDLAKSLWAELGDLETYRLYQKALASYQSFTPEGQITSEKLARRGLSIRPESSGFNALLAWVLWNRANWEPEEKSRSTFAEAVSHADKAIALNNGLADGHMVRAWLHLDQREYDQALDRADKARERAPSVGLNASLAGWIKAASGLPAEGLILMKLGMRLEPYYPSWVAAQAALVHLMLGQNDSARPILENIVVADNTDFFNRHAAMGRLAYIAQQSGDIASAKNWIGRLLKGMPNVSVAGTKQYYRSVRDQDFVTRYVDALRKAGLPE